MYIMYIYMYTLYYIYNIYIKNIYIHIHIHIYIYYIYIYYIHIYIYIFLHILISLGSISSFGNLIINKSIISLWNIICKNYAWDFHNLLSQFSMLLLELSCFVLIFIHTLTVQMHCNIFHLCHLYMVTASLFERYFTYSYLDPLFIIRIAEDICLIKNVGCKALILQRRVGFISIIATITGFW